MEHIVKNSILIIEDNKTISNIMKKALEADMSVEIFQVFSLDEARALLEQKTDFFVAVMGLSLKGAPRGEAVDYIMSKGIPSIVLTGTLDEEIRSEILSKNVIDYVLKQGVACIDHIKKLIVRLYMNQKIKALVVDDSRVLRAHYKNLLTTHQYQVIEAEDGEDALEKLAGHNDVKLVITDYHMPRVDGFELVRRIRQKHSKSEMIVIGISAKGNTLLPAKFLKTGANDFLKKPFESEEFYARVTQNVEYMEMLKKLRDAAIKDPLTQLYNRRHFFDVGERRFAESKQHRTPLTVTMVDIDFFKKVNDTYGHDGGDVALKHLSGLLLETMEEESHLLARFGGEEFCILSKGFDLGAAQKFFEDIRTRVQASSVDYKGQTIKFTISAGISDNRHDTLQGVINHADDMLYQAKAGGRNRVVLPS
ncbi:diguanylate cyclase [Desulfobacter vibrioformis]|uniref:diguanylate cyclase n=1 Tax=Desulfobacter vibrioformis TaxID=34031 RepID=UPI000557F0AE|nr:diguanylate cyclase [Desulfobacter vibrioformis]